MTEVIVFPDAAAIVIDYLVAQFTALSITAHVGTRLPQPVKEAPNPVVRVFRTGGLAEIRVLDKAQLTIEVYADDTATAHDLAQTVRGLVHAMAETVQSGVTIGGVAEFSGPQDFPDPTTDTPRYTYTIQVTMRGSAV